MSLHQDVLSKLAEDAGYYFNEDVPTNRREFDLFILEHFYEMNKKIDHLKWEIAQLEAQV